MLISPIRARSHGDVADVGGVDLVAGGGLAGSGDGFVVEDLIVFSEWLALLQVA